MLAIKECLIREGVLNLSGVNTNTTNNGGGATGNSSSNYNTPTPTAPTAIATTIITPTSGNNNCQHISTFRLPTIDVKLAMLRKQQQKSIAATQQSLDIENNSASSSNLSSASATAKISCQPSTTISSSLEEQQELESKLTEESTKQPITKSRYQGQHPHFHHHTAPVYYTDVNLRIHIPIAGDSATLNERYQSVYSTPSKLVKEHYFPKTSTATVVPPPIGTGTSSIVGQSSSNSGIVSLPTSSSSGPITTATSGTSITSSTRSSFFRGGSAGNEPRQNLEHYAKSSPTLTYPTKDL